MSLAMVEPMTGEEAYREQLRGLRVTVVGLARSGIAACHLLQQLGASVTATDAKLMGALSPSVEELTKSGVRLFLGSHPHEAIRDSELIVVSPGVPSDLPLLEMARHQRVPIIGEIELAWRVMEAPVIAITGTNGKTTTTALTGALLGGSAQPVFVGGNIGHPLSLDALSIPRDALVVAEVSSFQLETIEQFRPRVAAVLNLTPDHLDRYPSVAAYREAKARIFLNQTEEDWAILNADDPEAPWFAEQTLAKVVYFSTRREPSEGVFCQNDWIVARLNHRELEICPVSEVQLLGRHNLENVLAAAACALLAGRPPDHLRQVIGAFRGVPHRLEAVRELNGVAYYNDSKATNVSSTLKAFESFTRPIVLIAGGLGKGQDFAPLGAHARGKVRMAVLIGNDRDALRAALTGTETIEDASSLEEAVLKARHAARPGEVILFSPACASFDMFRDYEHRGDTFKSLVNALVNDA
jgi:UDP-N-acetylmuramoylalanine--D-glutamate ligase